MIVFYDGDCGLCQRSVQILCRYDKDKLLHFAPLNGVTYHEIYGATCSDMKTVLFYKEGKTFERSTAAIELAKVLGGYFFALAIILTLIPKFLRDWGYDQVVQRRHQFSCLLMTHDERFLP